MDFIITLMMIYGAIARFNMPSIVSLLVFIAFMYILSCVQ